jgi:hypothetical protein
MAYSLWWAPVVRHHAYWITPGDFWATARDARFVAWGYLGGVYSAGTGLVALPGFPILFAPVTMVASALGLVEAYPNPLPHPTAWLVFGPVVLLANGAALWALDRLARRLGLPPARRLAVDVLAAGTLWPVTALWGHPEDVLALAGVLLALRLGLERRLAGAGWATAAAVALQPFALLAVPALLAFVGRRGGGAFVVRAASLPAFLLAVVLAADFRDAWRALTVQPNFPTVDWPTPLLALASRVGPKTVAAGPMRVLAAGAACLLGVLAAQRRDAAMVVFAVGAALAARCILEPVMVPYYLAPGVVVLALGAAVRGARAFAGAAAAGALAVLESFWHGPPFPFWALLTALSFLLAALAFPRAHAGGPAEAVPSRL